MCKSHAAERVDTSVGGQIIVLALLSCLSFQFHFIKLQILRQSWIKGKDRHTYTHRRAIVITSVVKFHNCMSVTERTREQ